IVPSKGDFAMTLRNNGMARWRTDSLADIPSRMSQPAEESLLTGAFGQQLASTRLIVDDFIDLILTGQPEHLYDATTHYINNGGKRLRPFLLMKSCELLGGSTEQALPIAAAIE